MGIVLRLWKIDYGLPHIFYGDEGWLVGNAMNLSGNHFEPPQFAHPHLFIYFVFCLYAFYTLAGLLLGIFNVPGDAWKLFLNDPTVFYVIGRMASVVFGSLTLWVTFLMGRRVFNEKAGLLGAFFLAFSLMHVQWSQLAYSDAPLVFFMAWASFLSFLASERGASRYFLLSGLAAGLATSTKYHGLVTLLLGPLSSLIFQFSQERKVSVLSFLRNNSLFFLFFILGFTIGTPFWILDFEKFKQGLLWDFYFYKPLGAGQLGYEGNWNWAYYLLGPLMSGLGPSVGIFGILGFVVLGFQLKTRQLSFFLFPLIYFFALGALKIRVAKYALPLFPFLALSAGFLVTWVTSKLIRGEGKGYVTALVLSGLVLAFPGFLTTIHYLHLKMLPDTREQTLKWVSQNISPENQILQTAYAFLPDLASGPRIRPLDKTIFDTSKQHPVSLKSLEEYRKEGIDYLVLDGWHLGMVEQGGRNRGYGEALRRYHDFTKEVNVSTDLAASFSPYREGFGFQMEHVEIPSRSLWTLKGLGPPIRIYKLKK